MLLANVAGFLKKKDGETKNPLGGRERTGQRISLFILAESSYLSCMEKCTLFQRSAEREEACTPDGGKTEKLPLWIIY